MGTDRLDWCTFRVDRILPRTPTGPHFEPRELPDRDIADYVSRRVGSAMWEWRATVTIHAPAEAIADRLPPAVGLRSVDDHTCVLEVGADTPHILALYLGMLDVDFEVREPPELLEHLRKLAARYSRAAKG
jgi:predicted DNA-binding transcriptional regulator YafY